MERDEIRIEALKMALSCEKVFKAENVVKTAQTFEKYISPIKGRPSKKASSK